VTSATVRVAGGPDERLAAMKWTVLGHASRFSRVRLVDGAVTVDIHPGADEQPRSLALQLQAVGAEGSSASAAGSVELLPRVTTTEPDDDATTARRRPSITVVIGVLALVVVVAIVAVVVFVPVLKRDNATVAGSHPQLRVHSTLKFSRTTSSVTSTRAIG
jgi:hypothetical protein